MDHVNLSLYSYYNNYLKTGIKNSAHFGISIDIFKKKVLFTCQPFLDKEFISYRSVTCQNNCNDIHTCRQIIGIITKTSYY